MIVIIIIIISSSRINIIIFIISTDNNDMWKCSSRSVTFYSLRPRLSWTNSCQLYKCTIHAQQGLAPWVQRDYWAINLDKR